MIYGLLVYVLIVNQYVHQMSFLSISSLYNHVIDLIITLAEGVSRSVLIVIFVVVFVKYQPLAAIIKGSPSA